MLMPEAYMNSQGEVGSLLHSDQQEANRNNPFAPLVRQSSIYSLTLDEFQQTLCDSRKNFGSMNMDEFLNTIWYAEESQAIVSSNYNSTINNNNNFGQFKPINEASTEKGIRSQPSLPRQCSLTIPSQLCRKTVDEVWSEIHKGQQRQRQQQQSGNITNNDNVRNIESTHRQPTFGEMTLEDFLVKAGVVREACPMPPPAAAGATQQQHTQYMYANSHCVVAPTIIARPTMSMPGSAGGVGGAGNVLASYTAVGPGGGAMGDPSGYAGNGKRDTGYPPTAGCYGGRVVNSSGGYGAAPQTFGMPAPVSPSSDGLGTSENSGQFGMEMGMLRGRKRITDSPVEKVVERRQRRMIKNRESAARSRARKQVPCLIKCKSLKTCIVFIKYLM